MLICPAFTRKKLAIDWAKVLELLHASNCLLFMNKGSSKSLKKANQAIARFYLLQLLHLYFVQLHIPFSVSVHNVNRPTYVVKINVQWVYLLIIYLE